MAVFTYNLIKKTSNSIVITKALITHIGLSDYSEL